eukprot:491959-Amphidinium_carterae.1
MVLYYFLLFPDQDVRQYSYEALSSTISIFCAVLSFQAQNLVLALPHPLNRWRRPRWQEL